MLGFTLKVFVPTMLATRPDGNANSPDLDALALIIGSSVIALRTRDRAKGVVAGVLGEDAESKPVVEAEEDVDALVRSFVKWLSTPTKGRSSRNDLLTKLRSRPEFAGQFVLG